MGEQRVETGKAPESQAANQAEDQVGGQPTPHKGRGGARPGAGRKAKWGEKTVVMRVPVSMREAVEEFLSLKAQGVELVRQDEAAAQADQAAQAAREQALADARAELAATAAGIPAAAVAAVAQAENQPAAASPTPSFDAAPAAPAKPKKPRAPRKKNTQDVCIDPSRQGSLFDLL